MQMAVKFMKLAGYSEMFQTLSYTLPGILSNRNVFIFFFLKTFWYMQKDNYLISVFFKAQNFLHEQMEVIRNDFPNW